MYCILSVVEFVKEPHPNLANHVYLNITIFAAANSEEIVENYIAYVVNGWLV